MLNISGLQEGIVLDHIEAGKSLDIYYHLGLDKLECQVAIIKNARSNKMGRKDIIKIEGGLDTVDLKVLGYIDHNITVNIIRGDKIAEKRALKLPKKITNVIQCKNPRCITSIEQELPHIFYLGDGVTDFTLELTWLRDRKEAYDLGECEFHLAFHVDDFDGTHKHHEEMGCICYENPGMGIYFIKDPDGYWLEIVPADK